jgi:hypothetical protein
MTLPDPAGLTHSKLFQRPSEKFLTVSAHGSNAAVTKIWMGLLANHVVHS